MLFSFKTIHGDAADIVKLTEIIEHRKAIAWYRERNILSYQGAAWKWFLGYTPVKQNWRFNKHLETLRHKREKSKKKGGAIVVRQT